MRGARTSHIFSADAGGEVGDVIFGGVASPAGYTLCKQCDFDASGVRAATFFRHLNRLLAPQDPAADRDFIILEPADAGTHQLMPDPTEPWPGGYRLSDTSAGT